jgi:hypothetical protein
MSNNRKVVITFTLLYKMLKFIFISTQDEILININVVFISRLFTGKATCFKSSRESTCAHNIPAGAVIKTILCFKLQSVPIKEIKKTTHFKACYRGQVAFFYLHVHILYCNICILM